MTDDKIRTGILRVCKVASWDSDFNVVGFHALCDKLKELGAAAERDSWPAEMEAMERQVNILTDELARAKAAEREACIQVIKQTKFSNWFQADCIETIRARG